MIPFITFESSALFLPLHATECTQDMCVGDDYSAQQEIRYHEMKFVALQQLCPLAWSQPHLWMRCFLQTRYGFKAHKFHAANVNSKEEYDAKFGSDLFITVSWLVCRSLFKNRFTSYQNIRDTCSWASWVVHGLNFLMGITGYRRVWPHL